MKLVSVLEKKSQSFILKFGQDQQRPAVGTKTSWLNWRREANKRLMKTAEQSFITVLGSPLSRPCLPFSGDLSDGLWYAHSLLALEVMDPVKHSYSYAIWSSPRTWPLTINIVHFESPVLLPTITIVPYTLNLFTHYLLSFRASTETWISLEIQALCLSPVAFSSRDSPSLHTLSIWWPKVFSSGSKASAHRVLLFHSFKIPLEIKNAYQPASQLYYALIAAVTNYHKLRGIKHCKCIVL